MELEPREDKEINLHHSPSRTPFQNHVMSTDAYHTIIEDAFKQRVPEPPNQDAHRFYDLLDASQHPPWNDCIDHYELSVALRLISIKSQHNMSRSCFI